MANTEKNTDASSLEPTSIPEKQPSKPKLKESAAAIESPLAVSRNGANPGRSRALSFGLAVLIIFGVGFGGGWLGAASHGDQQSSTISEQKTILTSQGALVSSIAKEVGPSVVSVNVTTQTATNGYNSLFGLYGNDDQTEEGAGTGMILTADGLIMTNRHVVPSGTTSVSVTLSDGTIYEDVKVVGRTSDRDNLDVAFLKIQDTKGKALTPVKLGDSSKMAVGDSVIAIGNALGQFQNTVTSGIISGYGRSVTAGDEAGTSTENLDNLFQTDAAINPGNSGGPLVNLNGEVIGMNTAVASDSQNIGFAIPINDLKGLVTSVKDTGKLQRPYLGIMYVPITNDVKEQFNLSTAQGAYILNRTQAGGQETVVADGPAAKAGVEAGDIITKVDGSAINEQNSLTSVLGKYKVGDKVVLTIIRDGKTITKDLTLGAAPTDS